MTAFKRLDSSNKSIPSSLTKGYVQMVTGEKGVPGGVLLTHAGSLCHVGGGNRFGGVM